MKNTARKTQSEKAASKSGELQQKKKTDTEQKDVLYQIKTKRSSDVLKAYITFTYRVFHPKVTARMLLYGLMIFVPGFILLGLFRQYISLAITKRADEDYRNGTEFVYEFTQNDASFYREGELTAYSNKYKDIDAVFYDEDYYYLSLTSREFFVIPMSGFTIGDPSTFGDFMYKRCKKVCRWIPAKPLNKLKKMRSQRAVARDQIKK